MSARAPSVSLVVRVALVLLTVSLAACRSVADPPSRIAAEPAVHVAEPSPGCEPGTIANGVDPCGSRKRVSLLLNVHGSRFATALPCDLEIRRPPIDKAGQRLGTCIAAGTLYVSGDCIMCRVVGSGWTAVATLDELTADQALALQSRMGLPTGAPLVGENAWRQALALPANDPHASL